MDKAVTIHGKVEQESAVVAHTAVIQVGQFINGLYLIVLALVIEPPRTDTRITLAGTPRITVGMTRLQLLILRVAGIDLLDAQE